MNQMKNGMKNFIKAVKSNRGLRIILIALVFVYIIMRNTLREMSHKHKKDIAVAMSIILILTAIYPSGIFIVKAEGELGEELVSGDITSGNQTALENESTSEEQSISGNLLISEEQTISENGAISQNETTSGNQTTSDNQTISGNELSSENQTFSGDQTTSGNETTSGNQSISENQGQPIEEVIPEYRLDYEIDDDTVIPVLKDYVSTNAIKVTIKNTGTETLTNITAVAKECEIVEGISTNSLATGEETTVWVLFAAALEVGVHEGSVEISALELEENSNLLVPVSQEVREVIFPQNIVMTYGQTLEEIELLGGSSFGTFTWENLEGIPDTSWVEAIVVFTPVDGDKVDYTTQDGYDVNTGTIIRTISITVQKAILKVIAPSKEIEVGDELPTVSLSEYTYLGFCYQDNSLLLKNLTATIYGVTDSNKAIVAYAIEPKDVYADNYIIEFMPGTLTILPKVANESFFTVQGTISSRMETYISDIVIIPNGVDGFSKVRVGENGKFSDQVILTKDTLEGAVDLYFAKGEAISQAYEFTYSKDAVAPVIGTIEKVEETNTSSLWNWFVGNSAMNIKVHVSDDMEPGNIESLEGSGVNYLQYSIDGVEYMEKVANGYAIITLEKDYKGIIKLYCLDRAGNLSKTVECFNLIDREAPKISLEVEENDIIYMAPYEINFIVEDMGTYMSGIQSISYIVNNEVSANIVSLSDEDSVEILEEIELDEKTKVISACTFGIVVEENGKYEIAVTVTDYAGNQTTENYYFEVVNNDIIRIVLPTTFNMYVAPGNDDAETGEIFSDTVHITNMSNFDVDVTMSSLEFSVGGVDNNKDCDLYMNSSALEQDIPVLKGTSSDVMKFTLSTEELNEEINVNMATFKFYGDIITDNSMIWTKNDMKIEMLFSFKRAEINEQVQE